MSNEPCIALTVSQLADLLRSPESVTKDLMDARERLLKLEYKYKELVDILTDLRANQIMGTKEDISEIVVHYEREE